MADVHVTLRTALIEGYDRIMQQLRRRLRSADLAHDVLHDTYLRLDRVQDDEVVREPAAYVMRVAINVARDRVRSDTLRRPAATLAAVADFPDERGNTVQQVEARSDLNALSKALRRLPARRRRILLAACIEELSAPEIGARFGLSPRAVYQELQLAREFCAAVIGEPKK